MKLRGLKSSLGLGLAMVLLLGVSQRAAADLSTCKRALTKGQQSYAVAVARAKAKEARGRVPGQKFIPSSVTAAKIAKALEKARLIIQAGCAGVASPNDADPNLCPGLNFDDCLADFAGRADANVQAALSAVPVPLCIDEPPPVCNAKGLPACDPENGCFCHSTLEGMVDCINDFRCETAQTCTTSADCPTGQACYVETCCGATGFCGPSTCQPPSLPIKGASSAR